MNRSVLLPPSRPGHRRGGARARALPSGRGIVLSAIVLVLAQAGVGMAVNLYGAIPAHHPGAHPSSYLSGSFHSVSWAIRHGTVELAAHAALGLALVLLTLALPIRLLRVGRVAAALGALVAAALVLAAGFNGASFLDYAHDANSLAMALLCFSAVACYGVVLALMD